jgi:hypothetical protein
MFVPGILLFSLACSRSAAGPDAVQPAARVDALVDALRQQGATATRVEQLSPESHCLSVGARRLLVNGENVYAFEYQTTGAAERDAATISPDGSSITPAGRACMVSWSGPPRFYRQDRLLALYVGTNQDLIRLLDRVLGSPFAHR